MARMLKRKAERDTLAVKCSACRKRPAAVSNDRIVDEAKGDYAQDEDEPWLCVPCSGERFTESVRERRARESAKKPLRRRGEKKPLRRRAR